MTNKSIEKNYNVVNPLNANSGLFVLANQTQNVQQLKLLADITQTKIANINNIINAYNHQFEQLYQPLLIERNDLADKLIILLNENPNSDAMRSKGVELMWKYLNTEAQIGGNSSQFTNEQTIELLERGKIRYFEGLHTNSVDKHPALQVNPDNLVPLEEHRNGDGIRSHFEAHSRNWRNPTDGELIDRNKILQDTNNQRVKVQNKEIIGEKTTSFKNELIGLGLAITIGFIIGFGLGFIISWVQTARQKNWGRKAIIAGLKSGSLTAIVSGISYGLTRTVGQSINQLLQDWLINSGVQLATNIDYISTMLVFGILTIFIFSIVQFVLLLVSRVNIAKCLIKIVKQLFFSLILLSSSVVAQSVLGGYSGIIASLILGLIFISFVIYKNTSNTLVAN